MTIFHVQEVGEWLNMLGREMEDLNTIQVELLKRKTTMHEIKHIPDIINGKLEEKASEIETNNRTCLKWSREIKRT